MSKNELLILGLLLFWFLKKDQAQNLVPNPSFEDTIACPNFYYQLEKTRFWSQPTYGNPDFFHECDDDTVSVPINYFGNQSARTGEAYVGFFAFRIAFGFYREYLQVELTDTLSRGINYCVSFYVSLADNSDIAIKELGLVFEPDLTYVPTQFFLNKTPDLQYAQKIIDNKDSWIRVAGNYIASGNEKYLLIGNFNDSLSTTSLKIPFPEKNDMAYYYVDDVSVSTDNSECATVGMENQSFSEFIQIYPNPTEGLISIFINDLNQQATIGVSNAQGKTILKKYYQTLKNVELDISKVPSGIYFVKIVLDDKIIIQRIAKQ